MTLFKLFIPTYNSCLTCQQLTKFIITIILHWLCLSLNVSIFTCIRVKYRTFCCHFLEKFTSRFIISIKIRKILIKKQIQKFHEIKLNCQKLDIEIPVDIPVNFMILTGTGIPAYRPILTGILPGSRSILGINALSFNLFDHWYHYIYNSFSYGLHSRKRKQSGLT